MKLDRKQWLWIAVALLLLAGLKVVLIRYYLERRGEPANPTPLACRVDEACALPQGGRLSFVTPPRHGQPFLMRLDGVAGVKAPTVEFSMEGMDMGFNRYVFVREGDAWTARVTLPLCVSGSRNWIATLESGGARYRLPFSVR